MTTVKLYQNGKELAKVDVKLIDDSAVTAKVVKTIGEIPLNINLCLARTGCQILTEEEKRCGRIYNTYVQISRFEFLQLVYNLAFRDAKIDAIKLVQRVLEMGLKESKELVEALRFDGLTFWLEY